MTNVLKSLNFVLEAYRGKPIIVKTIIQVGSDKSPDVFLGNITDVINSENIEIVEEGEEFILTSRKQPSVLKKLGAKFSWRVGELANILGMSKTQVRHMINIGELAVEDRVGRSNFRILSSSVLDMLAKTTNIAVDLQKAFNANAKEIEQALNTPANAIAASRIASIIQAPAMVLIQHIKEAGYQVLPQSDDNDPIKFKTGDYIKFIRQYIPDFMINFMIMD